MREILFRGKTDKGEWFEGQLLYFKASVGTGRLALIVEGCEWDNSNEWFSLGKRAKVIPETVGQFTGLTDKNGKKIFEGDIIRTRRNETYQEELKGYHGYDSEGYPIKLPGYKGSMFVTRERTNYDYRAVVKRGRYGEYYLSGTTMFVDAICNEVIGNIHDNPELLNKEN